MRFVYEAVLEIDNTMAVDAAINGIDSVVKAATKDIKTGGKPIEIPKEFYKIVLFKLAQHYGIEVACL